METVSTIPVIQTSNVVITEQPVIVPSSPGVVTGPPLPASGNFIHKLKSIRNLRYRIQSTFVSGIFLILSDAKVNPWAVALITIMSGGLPHNAEINELLALTKVAIGVSASEVGSSERGQRIAADMQSILDTIARFLVVKNADEKFQRFLIHTGQLTSRTAKGFYFEIAHY